MDRYHFAGALTDTDKFNLRIEAGRTSSGTTSSIDLGFDVDELKRRTLEDGNVCFVLPAGRDCHAKRKLLRSPGPDGESLSCLPFVDRCHALPCGVEGEDLKSWGHHWRRKWS